MIKEPGTYIAKAVEVTLGESKQKGTPYVGVIFNVTEGSCAGTRVRWEGYLTDRTAERTLESLQHCGWTGDDISVFARGELTGIGQNEVELVIEMEPGVGENADREYPKVQWVNRKGGGVKFMGEAVNPARASHFGQKYRGLAASLRAKSGKPAVNNTTKPAATGSDDEIPF